MTESRCKVKICGTTTVADAQMVVEAGVDYSGIVVETPFSERSISIPQAAEIARYTPIPTIALVFNRPIDWVQKAVEKIEPFAIQLLGHEVPHEILRLKRLLSCEVWKSLFLPSDGGQKIDARAIYAQAKAYISAGADALLLDTVDFSSAKARFGGTGRTSDWNFARQLIGDSQIPAFLSGGIRSENVRAAIENVRPYGIDLCSGVESAKGVRDSQKLELLMQQVRAASIAHSLPT
jgi:phosphoribosylanthranilate isomerase